VWCLDVTPTFSISFVLIARWLFVKRLLFGVNSPVKYFLSVATPELIHNNESSLIGTSDFDGNISWFLLLKKFNHVCLIWSKVNFFIILVVGN
jgi:hypothetical protein